ncbi:MAG: sigma-70 family RNA polymerase sigma factor [Clostridia bacterium]|nr:sigma-70 family RNA polymerase sigma factor [Clostridia bacterium]
MSERDENSALLLALKDGDESALDAIVERNMGLVRSAALRFTGRGMEYDDLVQTGVIGMIKAARSFDPSFGCVFSTYAVPLIIGEIKRTLRDDGTVKIGRELKRRAALAARARERLENRLGREPRLSELAEEAGMTPDETAEALAAYSPVRSLSEPADGEDGCELGGMIADPDDPYSRVCEREALGRAISGLGEFERRLVDLRFRRELSQSRVGELLGVSQVRVSRSEKKIIEKLRAAMGG